MKNIRQNFLIPENTKKLLDKRVPKGKQSKYVSEAIEQKILSEKSWDILRAPVLLNIKNSLKTSKKIRRNWERN